MIGLDSNILVRILVRDDERQTALAERLISGAGPSGAYVSLIVLVETVWVLESVYGLRREEIAQALDRVTATAELEIESREVATAALSVYVASSADFADALIGEVDRAAGCTATATFDRRAAKLKGFCGLP
jgi:predicted nucleic-acid-binding protein